MSEWEGYVDGDLCDELVIERAWEERWEMALSWQMCRQGRSWNLDLEAKEVAILEWEWTLKNQQKEDNMG